MEWSNVVKHCHFYRSHTEAESEAYGNPFCRKSTIYEQEKKKEGLDERVLQHVFGGKEDPIKVVPNKFPYDLSENIEHWLVWFHPKHFQKVPTSNIVDQLIEEHLGATVCYDNIEHKEKQIVWHENPEKFKSVKNIPHIHVFVKTK